MEFNIRMGVPEMEAFWNDISSRKRLDRLSKAEAKFFSKLVKALLYLKNNPMHPGLKSHEIDALSRNYGVKTYQSYLENNTPSAGRLFWAYGPNKGEITLLAIEPHPEDKKRGSYQRIKLSSLPSDSL